MIISFVIGHPELEKYEAGSSNWCPKTDAITFLLGTCSLNQEQEQEKDAMSKWSKAALTAGGVGTATYGVVAGSLYAVGLGSAGPVAGGIFAAS